METLSILMSILMIRAKEGASLILKVCGKGKIIITSSARYAHVMKVFSQCSFIHHVCSFYCLDPSYKLITWIIVSLQVEEFIHGFRRQRRGRQGCDLCERHWRHHIFLPRRQRLPSRGQVRNCIVLDMYWTTRIQGGVVVWNMGLVDMDFDVPPSYPMGREICKFPSA